MLLSRVLQFKNRYTQYSEMTCIHIFILWMAMSSYISALFHAVLCCIAGNLCPGHHGSQYGAPSLNKYLCIYINVRIGEHLYCGRYRSVSAGIKLDISQREPRINPNIRPTKTRILFTSSTRTIVLCNLTTDKRFRMMHKKCFI